MQTNRKGDMCVRQYSCSVTMEKIPSLDIYDEFREEIQAIFRSRLLTQMLVALGSGSRSLSDLRDITGSSSQALIPKIRQAGVGSLHRIRQRRLHALPTRQDCGTRDRAAGNTDGSAPASPGLLDTARYREHPAGVPERDRRPLQFGCRQGCRREHICRIHHVFESPAEREVDTCRILNHESGPRRSNDGYGTTGQTGRAGRL